MLKIKHIRCLLLMSITVFASCEREPLETQVSIHANQLEVNAGEPVKFTINSNANYLSIYQGEFESNYLRSAHYLLNGKTNQDLQDNIYRDPNPNVDVFNCLVNNTNEGAIAIVDGNGDKQIECRVDWGYNDFGYVDQSDGEYAKVVYDGSIDKNVLEVNVQQRYGWRSGPKYNMRAQLGTKRFLTIRMRHSIDSLMNKDTKLYDKLKTTYRVSVFAEGWKANATETGGIMVNAEQQYDIIPSMEYKDVVLDLTPLILKWEDKQGGKMVKLEAVQICLGTTDNVGFCGQYFIESVGFGTIDYYPFASGTAIPVVNASGQASFTHTYKEPGEYEVVVVATNVGFKTYKGDDYKDNRGDAINANEYGYSSKTARVKIKVN